MNERDELILSLSRDLEPVSRVPSVNMLALGWLLVSAVCVVAMIHLMGPIRPGAYSQLVSEPRFLFENLLGATAIAWVGLAAFRAAIPAALSKSFAATGLILVALWLAQFLVGLVSPALEPSQLGKRDYCWLETIAYSIPAILIALFGVRRLYPLRYVRTAMTLSLAAGMLPALYMQLACMYEPKHILVLHLLPGLSMVLIGAAIAALWRPRHGGVTVS
jgi:hypothetical protein